MNKYISNKYKVYFHALLGKTLLKMIILPILIQVNQKKKKKWQSEHNIETGPVLLVLK